MTMVYTHIYTSVPYRVPAHAYETREHRMLSYGYSTPVYIYIHYDIRSWCTIGVLCRYPLCICRNTPVYRRCTRMLMKHANTVCWYQTQNFIERSHVYRYRMAILVSHWRHIRSHRYTSLTTKLSDGGVPSVYYTDVHGVYAYIHQCTVMSPRMRTKRAITV
jgi:hypothetical protein